jgi:hypothetical protein
MKTQSIRPGDIVHSDVRGQTFFARVVDRDDDKNLLVEPLDSRITYRVLTARQVVGHYRKAKGSR